MKSEIHPVFDDILHAFSSYKKRIALYDKDGKAYTYAEFQAYVSGAYQELNDHGVGKGSKVLVAVPMSLQLYAILEALFAHGATAIFLDPWMKGRKMGSVIRQVQPDLFVVTKKLSRITWLLPATWSLKKWKVSSIHASDQPYTIAPVADHDNALITFTSGTSGNPKGANRTFSFLEAQAETLKAHLGIADKPSTDYTNFPIVGLANFALGNAVAIPQLNLMKIDKGNAREILDQLEKQKVSRLVVSPRLLQKIINYPQKNTTIQTVMTGGAPISISLVNTALQHYPHVHFEAIYGSTEAEPICITTFNEIKAQLSEPLKGVYVGQPVAEIKIKVISTGSPKINADLFEQIQLTEGKIGEIVVTGDHVNKNYYKNKAAFEKNKIVSESGEIWHRTGDIGYMEQGVIYLVGRDHRIMEKGGEKYYPYPIEQFLELTFGITDLGYLQQKDGRFALHYFHEKDKDHDAIVQAINQNDYPIDSVIRHKKPLPRDARHKSKLQIETLL